jgi:3-oxoacyl-[acyl-carrier protein] reductase
MENTTAVLNNNRTVLVTGGARGIGKAVVEKFASEGYQIAINYNSSETRAKELLDTLTKQGVSAMIVKADISNEDEVKNMVSAVVEKFGKIDVLVNNSAVCYDSLFQDKTREQFIRTMEVNVLGTFMVSRIVGDIMYNNKYGKIINLSSTNGINTYFPMCIDYDASKAAINSLTHNLATQFAPFVTVNAVAPGFIATESEVDSMDEEFIAMETEKVMVKRAGLPEDVANLVYFLASDNGDFINNQVIKIDGGIYGDC